MKSIYVSLFLIGCCFISYSCKDSAKREISSLNGNWSFYVDSSSTDSKNLAETGLPEELTRIASVPHDWNAEKGPEKYWGSEIHKSPIKIKNITQTDV